MFTQPKVSRRRLVQGSALTAGSLALAPRLDVDAALAQETAGTPVTQPAADRALLFDFPDFQIGTAVYPEGQTGCTVFLFPFAAFPDGVMIELDVRGGAPAYIGDYGVTNAICLAGGSVYGLEAATGVASELYAQSGFTGLIPVSGAVIYDVAMVVPPDGTRDKGIYPDKALGQAAVRAAQPGRFPLGAYGAGTGATVGQWVDFPHRREPGGQGGAFRQIGPLKIAFFTVVNALGVIVDRQGQVVRGGLNKATGQRPAPIVDAEQILAGESALTQTMLPDLPGGLTRHTTLSVLIPTAGLNCG